MYFRKLLISLPCLALMLGSLTHCGTVDLAKVQRSEPIAKKDTPWAAAIAAEPAYAAEMDYVRTRRKAATLPADKDTVALCFSGGGLRAATIQLGVLQGLQQTGKLKNADFLSTVSGGSYISAWYVSHLLPPGEKSVQSDRSITRGGNNAYHADPNVLLQVNKIGPCLSDGPCGAVDELEDNRGFVFGKANVWLWSGVLPMAYATVFPLNFGFDFALHFRPTRGKFNWHHLSVFYERALRTTYLLPPVELLNSQERDPEGFFANQPHEITLQEINPKGSAAPYLVLNAALTNAPTGLKPTDTQTLPFEFSRLSCGAPYLGYVPSQHFGYPVESVKKSAADGTGEVIMRANSFVGIPMLTKPFRLSTAVAASGAAVDSSFGGTALKSDRVWPPNSANLLPVVKTKRLMWDFVLKPLNLNLRHQNRNFAMLAANKNGPWSVAEELQDRGREVTMDRIAPTVNSNSLILSDGAHWDNLGIFAMVQRPSVKEIWSFDAGNDGKYVFNDAKHIDALLKHAGWGVNWHGRTPWCTELSKTTSPHTSKYPVPWDTSPVFKATLTKGKRVIKLMYVKSSYRVGDGADSNYIDADGKEWALNDWFEAYRKKNTTGAKFPHTSTGNVGFTKDDFNAYREMGRVLAKKLNQNLK